MDVQELLADLESTCRHVPGPDNDALRNRRRLSHLRAAWLLIALGRYAEAVESAGRARRAHLDGIGGFGRTHEAREGICAAQAVAHLARGRWKRAEECAAEAGRLSPEAGPGRYLLELALHAQGRLGRHWMLDDPARELASFDPRGYAIARLATMPAAPPVDTAGRAASTPAGTRARPKPPSRRPLPRDEPALRASLEEVRAAADGAADRDPQRAWRLYVRTAWLTIALGRLEEALEAVARARRAYFTVLGKPGIAVRPSYGEPLFEAGCEAEAAACLALGRWGRAEDAALRGLPDHLGGNANEPLLKLAKVAQGASGAGWARWEREFAVWDARQYALRKLRGPAAGGTRSPGIENGPVT